MRRVWWLIWSINLALKGQDIAGTWALGNQLWQQGLYQQAWRLYERALYFNAQYQQLPPAQLHFQMGLRALEIDSTEQAARHLARAYGYCSDQKDPDSCWNIFLWYVHALIRDQQLIQAYITLYSQSQPQEPTWAWWYQFYEGLLFYEQERYDEALQTWTPLLPDSLQPQLRTYFKPLLRKPIPPFLLGAITALAPPVGYLFAGAPDAALTASVNLTFWTWLTVSTQRAYQNVLFTIYPGAWLLRYYSGMIVKSVERLRQRRAQRHAQMLHAILNLFTQVAPSANP